MKRSVLIISFFVCSQLLIAQSIWDSTYRPDIYPARLAMFKTMPIGKKDIVFYGNSITFWGDWPELLGSARYKNRGIPGDTSFGLLELLGKGIGKPKQVFIAIGINDLARGIPVEVIMENYKRMLALIRSQSPDTKICFQSVLPINASFKKLNNHYKRADEIPQLNQALQQWATAEGIVYVDVFTALADAEGRLNAAYTWDGVHLTIEGYQQWVKVLKAQRLIK